MDPDVSSLYDELENSKQDLKKDLQEVGKLKGNLQHIFPEKIEARNRMFLDDKLKIFNEIHSTSLRIKQEIHKLINSQIKIKENNKPRDTKDLTLNDIRKIVDEIEGDKDE